MHEARGALRPNAPEVDLDERVRKYAFDREVTLSAVTVDAMEAWLDQREG